MNINIMCLLHCAQLVDCYEWSERRLRVVTGLLGHEWVCCAPVTTINSFTATWTVARRYFERVDTHEILLSLNEINLIIYTIFGTRTLFFGNVNALKHTFLYHKLIAPENIHSFNQIWLPWNVLSFYTNRIAWIRTFF